MRILIVGAGPTGLTAAVELARRGPVADVIDKKEQASTLSRAVGILPRSLAILEPSGVTARLLAEGIRLRFIRMYRGRRPALTVPLAGGHSRQAFALALAQDRTEAALHDVFAGYGGRVRYDTELTTLRQEDGQVHASTADGATTAYDYVIGADGIHSAVRRALGIDFNGHDLPETWSIADVDADGWPNGDALTFSILGGGRVVVVAPLEATRYRVISNTEDALATLPLDLDVKTIRRQGRFTISIRQVTRYSRGGVYLAGDAAHCHSPAGGRGMNLGIADAAELAKRMVEGELDGYNDSRHTEGAAVIAFSERIRKMMTSPSPVRRGALAVGFAMLSVLPPLRRGIARTFLGE